LPVWLIIICSREKLNEERAVSSIRKLKDSERIKEVAKLMSGEKLPKTSLIGARELMGQSKSSEN